MQKIGRNDPCPCGSGKKYKHCCGEVQVASIRPVDTSIPETIQAALDHHQAGRLAHAEAIYQQVLRVVPNQPDALHYLGLIAHQTGKNEVAVELISRAISVNPSSAKLCNLGLALKTQGKLDEAVASYHMALSFKPDCPEAYNNLGIVRQEQGMLDEAVASYRKAVSFKPDYLEALNNLGIVLQAQGMLDEAVSCYHKALSFKPDLSQAHYNLGVVLQGQGKFDEAIGCFRKALETSPELAVAHTNLAMVLVKQGKLAEAFLHYRKALDIAPTQIVANIELYKLLNRLVPPWHVPMMNDNTRNEAYIAALRTAIKPDSRVLDIGTGSGLLAMIAAQLGAMQVTTCEAEPLIATTAQRIIATNRLDNTIKVIPKRSCDMSVGADLDNVADLLVTEIFSSELLAENALSSIEDAKRRLLKPGARIIPASGSIMIALFGGYDIGSNLIVGDCCGFDVRHFNSIAPRKQVVMRNDLNIELLTDEVEAFCFNFENDSHFPEENKALRVQISAGGLCYGIIQWIRLRMDKETVFENHPSVKSPASGWQHCVYIFPEPITVFRNQVALISAAHDRVHPWFFLEGIKEPLPPA